LDHKQIKNCHLTSDDVWAARDIFGKDLLALRGKTTQAKEEHVCENKVVIPHKVLRCYRKVTLCIDIMKVNKLPFFTSISRNIQIITAEFISDMKDATLIESIKQICNTYQQGGFEITTIFADGQFESL